MEVLHLRCYRIFGSRNGDASVSSIEQVYAAACSSYSLHSVSVSLSLSLSLYMYIPIFIFI